MDILIPLLFMAIFYLGPALLKRYRAQLNKQLVGPELQNSQMMNSPPKIKQTEYMESVAELPTMVVEHKHNVPTIVEEQSAWQGKLDQNSFINGVIFAEIIQAPRAYRPFVRR